MATHKKEEEIIDPRVRITANGMGVISYDFRGSSVGQYHIHLPKDFYTPANKLKIVFYTDKGPISLEANEIIEKCTQLIQN